MIPVLFFRFSPLMFVTLTLWIPPSRRLTVICTRVPLYYSYFMLRLRRRLLHSTRVERFCRRLFRIPLLLRARLRAPHDNLSHSLHESSLQQISMILM
uniref:Secreted protein n=1 Tax=Picea sitchensis TaxID=3332 RepID=A9NM63_PICSI|nr:unknown [Picea sitchensis]